MSAQSPPLVRPPLLTRPFLLLSVAQFFQGLAMHLYVHMPGFLQQLGSSEVEIGVIVASMAGVAIAARPLVGRVIDRHGRRIPILVGGALHALVCLLYLTVHARGAWIVVVRGLHGLVEAVLFSALFTLAADIVPPSRRTEGLAWFGISGLLPIAFGGLVGDWVLAAGTYADLFALSAAFAVAAFVASLPVRDAPDRIHDAFAPPRGFIASVSSSGLLPLWFIGIVFATCLSAVFVFIKTYLLEIRVGSVGQFFASYIAAACAMRLFFGWVPDRVGAKRALVPAILAQAAGSAVLAYVASPLALAVAGVLTGVGHGFAFPTLAGLVVARSSERERGSAIALFTAIFDVGLLMGGPMFGAVVSAFGYTNMYLGSALLCFAGVVVYALWDPEPG